MPTTSAIGFIEAELEPTVAMFTGWLAPIFAPLGITLLARPCRGTLQAVMHALLPLTTILPRRYLLVPTQSGWTALFTNSHPQSDVGSPVSQMALQLGTRSLRLEHTADDDSLSLPGTIFEFYGPLPNPILNTIRSIAAVKDGTRWVFETFGPTQPFEQSAMYDERRVQDRFTVEMLNRYARQLGIHPFDEDFYLPERAVLVEKTGPEPKGSQQIPAFSRPKA